MTTSELRPYPSSLPQAGPALGARLAVLGATGAAAMMLLRLGCSPRTAVVTALAAATGAVTICTRLTEPYLAPRIRVAVLIIILVLVVLVTAAGYPPVVSVSSALGVAGCSTETARRLAKQPPRKLGLSR